MTQKSLHWNGSSVGDADALTISAADGIGYRLSNTLYESPWMDLMNRALYNGDENRGVLYGWANALAVTGIATPVSVDTGAAIVYGLFYENTAASNVVIASPTSDTRIDRIVIRRNWATQTARITLISGTEGGSAPAITQSPSPLGTGIYDIPLAKLSVTTGGVITVTDEREYCVYSTSFKVNEFATANIADSSVDWASRATRYKRVFIGGGDLSPGTTAATFTYYGLRGGTCSSSNLSSTTAAVWGGGAANEEGWRTNGAVSRALQCAFRLPADYYGGTIVSYIWWVNNTAVAASFSLISGVQIFRDGIAWPTWANVASSYKSVSITASGAASDVWRTEALSFSAPTGWTLTAGDTLNYWCQFSNTAGTEDINILGVEFYYEGRT